jgi:hypothetical protein
MISYSFSFIFRTKCSFCFSPPQRFRKFSKIFLPPKDIIEEMNHEKKFKFFDILPTSAIEEMIIFRTNKTKIKTVYFNFVINTEKKVTPAFHRKHKRPDDHNKINARAKLASCQCGQSYWIDYSLNDLNYFPENNKRCSIKINLKQDRSKY